jgi:hypothetical protein
VNNKVSSFFLITLILNIFGCSNSEYLNYNHPNKSFSIEEVDDCDYFPDFSFSNDEKIHEFSESWYSSHLKIMGECSLHNIPISDGNVIYRFLWLRTFHNPICFKLTKGIDTIELKLIVLSGFGGYDPGEVKEFITKSITESQYNKIESIIEELNFWNLSSFEETIGTDGAEWILEGRVNKNYHVIERWCGGNNEKFSTLLDYLLKLSEYNVKEKY